MSKCVCVCVCACMFSISDSCLILSTPWAIAHQGPMSIGFSRQEYLSGLPFPSPGNLPGSGIKPESSSLAGGFPAIGPPGKPQISYQSPAKR